MRPPLYTHTHARTHTHSHTHCPLLQAKAELDRLGELKRLQSELAFGSAIADFNQDLDAVEAELAERRAEMNAAQAELDAWEGGLPARRSAGHFFQSLYQKDTKKTPTGMNSEQLQVRVDTDSLWAGPAAAAHLRTRSLAPP